MKFYCLDLFSLYTPEFLSIVITYTLGIRITTTCFLKNDFCVHLPVAFSSSAKTCEKYFLTTAVKTDYDQLLVPPFIYHHHTSLTVMSQKAKIINIHHQHLFLRQGLFKLPVFVSCVRLKLELVCGNYPRRNTLYQFVSN